MDGRSHGGTTSETEKTLLSWNSRFTSFTETISTGDAAVEVAVSAREREAGDSLLEAFPSRAENPNALATDNPKGERRTPACGILREHRQVSSGRRHAEETDTLAATLHESVIPFPDRAAIF